MCASAWNDGLQMEIATINNQHRKIFTLMDELMESFRDCREALVLGNVLDDLMEYSRYHFGFEEGLFETYRYEGRREHAAEHRSFIERVQGLRKSASQGERAAAFETLDFLREWFQNHILVVDKKYEAYLKGLGVIDDIDSASPLQSAR